MRLLCVLAIACAAVCAQTTNTVNFNQLTINATGAGATSPILVPVAGGSDLTLGCSALANSPVILATAAAVVPGSLFIGANNIVDLDLGTLAFLFDGTGSLVPSPLSPYLHTNAAGSMAFIIPNGIPANASIAAQAAFINAGYATGLQVSAALRVQTPNLSLTGSPAPTGAAVPVPGAGDDTSAQIDITPSNGAAWFTFYGQALSDVFAGSNGYVTSITYTGLTESAATFASTTGGKKICAWWDDLNPGAGGTFTYYVNDSVPGNEIAEFIWTNVPEFSVGGSNTMKITLTPNAIVFDYGAMSSPDGLVGLSNGLAGSGVAAALTVVPQSFNQGASVQSPYQLFTTGANSMAGAKLTWVLGTHVATATAGCPVSTF